MISFPLRPKEANWDHQLGDDLSPYYVYWFDPVPWKYKLNKDAPCGAGYGYWVYAFKRSKIDVLGLPLKDSFTIHLRRGWNMIGYPFHNPPSIGLGDLRVSHGGKEVGLEEAYSKGWMWAGFYHFSTEKRYERVVPPGKLEEWKGYWAYAWKGCDLIIPKK